MDLLLAGKRAIVTGASRGIGFAVAEALVAETAPLSRLTPRRRSALPDCATMTSAPRSRPRSWGTCAPPGPSRRTGISSDAAEARLASGVSIGRLVTAAEVADVVVFLCSPRSAGINGDAIAVGGGAKGAIFY